VAIVLTAVIGLAGADLSLFGSATEGSAMFGEERKIAVNREESYNFKKILV
jgi:hypothetical protein